MSFDWQSAELLRKFIPLAKRQVTGNLVCRACSFARNDFTVVDGVTFPNVFREVVGKSVGGYELCCGHVVAPLILRDGEYLNAEE